jgi:mono/diheme cytochrome c family protein
MRILAIVGGLAIVVAIGAAIFLFGGFFNVAEDSENTGVVNWTLAQVRAASVARHATDLPSISLDDPATVEAGARVYAKIGCANCHGGPPDKDWAKFSEGLKPVPADLKIMAKERTASELFWVIKHGVKMTGMPSFGLAGASDEDIWKIVAFIKKLPSITDQDYKTWTASP